MEFYSIWVLPLCIFGIVNCLFLALVFYIKKPFQTSSDIIIGALLIALSLRIGKSIFYFLHPDISKFLISLGLMGKLAIGPLLFFFITFNDSKISLSKYQLLHFVPSLIIILTGWSFKISNLSYGFWAGTILMLPYIIYSWYAYYMKSKSLASVQNPLNKSILITISLIWLAFLGQLFSNSLESYMVGTFIAGLLLYCINFSLTLFSIKKTKSKSTSNISDSKKNLVADLILEKLNKGKIYKIPDLTLAKLAESIDQPVYVVSHVINENFKKKFPEFINHYRINEVKRILAEEKSINYTIEALAYDAGFNTPSAFYNSFKKETGLTPQKFIKKNHEKKENSVIK